jgi:hypothetical protein
LWNRYRHDTYKDRREDELPFIPKAEETAVIVAPKEEAKAECIKDHFELKSKGKHQKASGGEVDCIWWVCKQPNCKCRNPIKEINKGTGQLFRHMRSCNNGLWRRLKLGSKHSRTRTDDNGEEVQVGSFDRSECTCS